MSKRNHKRVQDRKTIPVKHASEIRVERTPITPFPMKSEKEREGTPNLVATFEVDDDEHIEIPSDLIIQNREDNSVHFDPDQSDIEQWDDVVESDRNLSKQSVANVLSQIYPNSTDNYVLSSHLRTFGYEAKDDGTIIIINGEILEDFDPADADFIFVPTDKKDNLSDIISGYETQLQRLPRYDTNAVNEKGERIHNPYGRSIVFAVIGDAGKIYAIKVIAVPLNKITTRGKPAFHLHRQRMDDKTLEARKVYRREPTAPRFSSMRKRLTEGEI